MILDFPLSLVLISKERCMDLLIYKLECKTKDPKSPHTLHPLIIKNTITNYTKSYSEYKPDV